MKHIRNFLLWIPAALWYRVVWGFSTQTAAVSGDLSDRLLWLLLERVSPSFAGADTAVRSAAVELLSFFERKAAHMFLYFVLALLLWLALSGLAGRITSRAAGTALLSALLAGLGGWHGAVAGRCLRPAGSGRARKPRPILSCDTVRYGHILSHVGLPVSASETMHIAYAFGK